jgi:MraZ protein
MLLTGSYRRTIDDKLRLAIPKSLRDALGISSYSQTGGEQKGANKNALFIAPGTDNSLVIYTSEVLEQVGDSLAKLSPAAKEARAFSRLFYAQVQPADLDRQGRIRIPPELAKLSGIAGEVMVIGVRDRIELWDAASWDQFLLETQPSYDDLAESVFQAAASDQS